MSRIGFSKCSILYAQARINSFEVSEPPCIPDSVVLDSYKYGVFSRGNFQIGTMGDGYVAINPYSPANNPTFASVNLTTSPTYVSTGYGGTAAAGVVGANNNSPFTQLGFTNGQNYYRTVGCGLRVRYMGSELNRSGRYICYREPNNNNINAGVTNATLMNNTETTSCPCGPEWCYVHFSPALAQDLAYGALATGNNLSMLIMVNGGTAGTVYEYEAVWWFETTGGLLPMLTPSSSDPQGFAVAQSALAVTQPTNTPSETWKLFLSEAGSIVKDTLSFLGPAVKVAATFL